MKALESAGGHRSLTHKAMMITSLIIYPKQKVLLVQQKQVITISHVVKGIYSEVSNSTWCSDTRLGCVEPLH
jgi:hypothetical protein